MTDPYAADDMFDDEPVAVDPTPTVAAPAEAFEPAAPPASAECAVPTCSRTPVQRGLCEAHWANLRGHHG